MLFSTVYFPEEIEDVENKLRLNLSDHAFSVLNYDMEAFGIGDANDSRIPSSFINHVFFSFKDEAASSIALVLRAKEEELLGVWAGLPGCSQAVEKQLAIYETQLLGDARRRLADRKKPFSIRADIRNLEYLRSDEGQAEGAYYNDRVGLYVKAVIEEYCQQPYAARERVFYRGIWNEVIRAVDERNVVKIKLRSRKNSQGRAQDNTLYMAPVCIEEDSEHMYNYLAGMIGPSQAGPWKTGAVRLSNVKTAECQKKSVHLSADEIKAVRSEIKKRGIQYLSDSEDPIRVVVQFTPYGEKLYRQILHLRPACKKKTDLIYEFECPLYQADTYFFKFGHNAKILEPQFLADRFKRKYLSAARQYE